MFKTLDVGSFWGRRKSDKKDKDKRDVFSWKTTYHKGQIKVFTTLPGRQTSILSGYYSMWSFIPSCADKNLKYMTKIDYFGKKEHV